MNERTPEELILRIEELENRLEESNQLIEAIKAGEVDAFAINSNNQSEIYTLQSGDYAYRVLIEEFGEGAINITEEGLIVYTNTYFFELLKLPFENVIGASFFDFIHSGSRQKFDDLFYWALSGKSKGEINLSINNTITPVYISLTSLQPALATVGIIITDLTEKKKQEEVIIQYQNDLEIKNLALQNSNADLASFAYVASHDLQEPLRKIQTFSRLIIEKEYQILSEKGKDYFERMQNSAERMQTLIQDLLTYSRTNAEKSNFEETDLNKIIEEVKKDLKEELLQKNAVLEINQMCKANIIPFQFHQMMVNLIGNSLKFSRDDKTPVIKFESNIIRDANLINKDLLPEKNYCHISITDNGIGFEPEYSKKIFELFQRLHGKNAYQGTGIGLAIVKKIVENHHGYITATGEPDKGARFDIFIPQ